METRKLYYEDSHLQTFSATVRSCQPANGGFEIILDATAFYPEGGGQPCDLGTLDSVQVLDVKERNGEIIHLCDAPLEAGAQVAGQIDWGRRFDHMQQHSGEHIVSGLIHGTYGYHNVGFHMGKGLVTIDFDGQLTWLQLMEIERQANRIIWENRKVKIWYPSEQELPNVNYRRKKDLPWPVRIVEFPGADVCACCGTQVTYTGQIGLVKFISCIKFKEGVRIEMAAGARAMAYYQGIFEQNRLVSQAFSAKMLETGAAAQRMNEQLAAEKFRSAGLQKRIFATIAAGYAGKENPVCVEAELTPAGVRELADAIAGVCTGIATVLSGSDEAGYSVCMVSRDTDVRPAGKVAAAALHGRGGGKPEAFQGSLKATRSAIAEYFRL